jgi:hypothetical protein
MQIWIRPLEWWICSFHILFPVQDNFLPSWFQWMNKGHMQVTASCAWKDLARLQILHHLLTQLSCFSQGRENNHLSIFLIMTSLSHRG